MKFLISFFILAAVTNCTSQTEPPATTTAAETATAKPDSIPFPIYLSYNEFKHHLERSNDTTYVVNFWATWCAPCVKELPYFEKLRSEMQGQPVQVLLVSMDFPKDIERKLVPFVAERKLENAVVALADLDYNAWIDQVSTEWDGAIPFTLVYNKKDRRVKLGEIDSYGDLEKFVREMM